MEGRRRKAIPGDLPATEQQRLASIALQQLACLLDQCETATEGFDLPTTPHKKGKKGGPGRNCTEELNGVVAEGRSSPEESAYFLLAQTPAKRTPPSSTVLSSNSKATDDKAVTGKNSPAPAGGDLTQFAQSVREEFARSHRALATNLRDLRHELAELQAETAAEKVNATETRRKAASQQAKTARGQAATGKHAQQTAVSATDGKENVNPQPRINPSSQALDRDLTSIYSWKAEKDLRRARLALSRRSEEERTCRSSPEIDAVSKLLAEHMNRPVRVEDHLLDQHSKALQRLEHRRALRLREIEIQAKPTLAPHSANLERLGDTCQRLYSHATVSATKRSESPITDQSPLLAAADESFRPAINPQSRELVREEPVQERLFRESAERRRRLQERCATAEIRRHEEAMLATRQVGAYSQFLAQQREERTQETPFLRLTRPAAQSKSTTQEEEFPFRPKIDPHSNEIDSRTNSTVPRHRLLHQKAEEYANRRSVLQRQQEHRELDTCSFSPNLPLGHSIFGSHTYEKNKEWLVRRHARLQRERQERDEREITMCPFRPHRRSRSHGRPNKTSHADRFCDHRRSSSAPPASLVNEYVPPIMEAPAAIKALAQIACYASPAKTVQIEGGYLTQVMESSLIETESGEEYFPVWVGRR